MKQKQQIQILYRRLHRASRHIGHGRLLRLGMASLVLVSIIAPAVVEIQLQRSYLLDAAAKSLVGHTNQNLADKISFDNKNNQWQFNKAGIVQDTVTKPNPAAALKAQVGGGGKKDASLYSVNMPIDGKKGVEYYDNNTNLSFSMEPQFTVGKGIERDGQLIYPMPDDAKIVYSAKNNGMKEDIVLTHNIGDSLQFSYALKLPDTLEARLESNGSIGVYSADPVLYTTMSYGSDTDYEKIQSARLSAPKDHVLFNIPAPIIKQTGDKSVKANAKFELRDDTLRVIATGMDTLAYPATVDPSVVITSSSDFSVGNSETNIDYPTGQVSRGGLTGGTLPTWPGSPTSYFITARTGNAAVAANGYMYVLGGHNGGYLSDVQYAPINSNGTVSSTWTATTSLNTARRYFSAVTYNGYIYVLGGETAGGMTNTVEYAKISADGAVGPWVTTTSFTTARNFLSADVSKGYIYISGGTDNTTPNSDIQIAPLLGTGAVGAWTTSATTLPTTRFGHTTGTYNGYMYMMGGTVTGTTRDTNVYYSKIAGDGTLSAWTTTTSLLAVTYEHAAIVADGYIYLLGGTSSNVNTVSYAPIAANGTLGRWQTTSSFNTGRRDATAIAYNGYIYLIGGVHTATDQACVDSGVTAATTYCSDVQYTTANAAGVAGSTSTSTYGTARRSGATVIYNGYIYYVGGSTTGSTVVATIDYAPLNADGTIGTWTTSGNSFTTARRYHTAEAYGGFLYVIGGGADLATVQYATLDPSTGAVGTWTANATSFSTGRNQHASAVSAGYMYVSGGSDVAQSTYYSDVQYAPINDDGSVGTWASTTSFTTARRGHDMVAYGGHMYLGGGTSATTPQNDIQYAKINGDGTLAAWASTTSFTTARTFPFMAAYNGFLYVGGGTVSSSPVGDMQYVPINSNGTVGTWASTASLTTARTYVSGCAAAANGTLYIVGGENGSGNSIATAEYASLGSGGGGTPGAWASTTSFTTARRGHATVAYNGYLYVIGGTNDFVTALSDVQYAPISASGAVGSWTTLSATPLPVGLYGAGVTAYNGYMYVAQGTNIFTGGQATAGQGVSYYAAINANGTLGTWQVGEAMFGDPNYGTAYHDTSLIAYRGFLYNYGGSWCQGDCPTTRVQYTTINANGTMGGWVNTTSLPVGLQSFVAYAANNFLYATGGVDASGNEALATSYIAINSDGSLGTSWLTTGKLPTAKYGAVGGVSNGYVYVMGGYTAAPVYAPADSVFYAPLNANGTVGDWQRVADTFATAREDAAGAMYNGRFIMTGGTSGSGTALNDVQYVALNAAARIGTYSKMINLGGAYTLTSMSYGGGLLDGAADVSVRSAGSNGVFGSAQGIDAVTTSSPLDCLAGTVQYLLFSITLDDTKTSTVMDNANPPNLTDLTIGYAQERSAPNLRLRAGKFFSNEALQPLDTCITPGPYDPVTTPPSVIGGSSVATTNGTSLAIATNSSSLTGDLVIVSGYIEPENEGTGSATYGTVSPPAGTTLLPGFPINTDDSRITTGFTHRLYAWYYYATANGAQTLTFTSTANLYWGLSSVTIRGGPISGNPLAETASTAVSARDAAGVNVTPNVSLNLGDTNSLVLWLYGDWDGTNSGYPTGFTDRAHPSNNAGQPAIGSKVYTTAGTTGTVDQTRDGNHNGMTAALLSIRQP